MSGPVPLPDLTYDFSSMAGPSQAADTGDVGKMGTMTVGDYYARGSRVRQGAGWQEVTPLAVAAVAVVGLWLWMR